MTLAENQPYMTDRSEKETILELKNIRKHFPIKAGVLQKKVGAVKAVDGIDLNIYKGETLGIVGESGCGKSTLGRTMIRLYEPTEGQILFKGQDISHVSESKLRQSTRKTSKWFFKIPLHHSTLEKHFEVSSKNPTKHITYIP